MLSGITRLPVRKIAPDSFLEAIDPVVIEEPLAIRLQFGPIAARLEQDISITMRTPGHDEELALGFLFTEGILPATTAASTSSGAIPARTTVTTTSGPNGNTITVSLPASINPDLSKSARHSYTSSSCGVCGKTSLEALNIPGIPNTPDDLSIPASILYDLPALLREGQDLFEITGGLHAAGLFDRQGHLIALREDIGRHNALDKVIGHALQQHWLPMSKTILLLSGRACFELIQKAAMAGIRIVAAVGPPSSLAVRYAEESGITLVGFLRQQRFNIYCGGHRIRF
ncbi:sulfurtransferase FdhD [Puia dinghuensis]|uniref:Sulfur carrier protein FdhD n=1 Tax=Puia dinghuensis TaxID=1792502 RepID=A0A8J2XVJ5_9BACT|nr:sulfurtransferase FdhD [Puia dinghuensis]